MRISFVLLYEYALYCIMEYLEISNKIKERRDILCLHQRDLAELSGVSLRTIIQVENATGNPSLDTLQKLLKVLGMEMQIVVRT